MKSACKVIRVTTPLLVLIVVLRSVGKINVYVWCIEYISLHFSNQSINKSSNGNVTSVPQAFETFRVFLTFWVQLCCQLGARVILETSFEAWSLVRSRISEGRHFLGTSCAVGRLSGPQGLALGVHTGAGHRSPSQGPSFHSGE